MPLPMVRNRFQMENPCRIPLHPAGGSTEVDVQARERAVFRAGRTSE